MTDATGKIYTSGWFTDTKDFNPDKKLKYNLTSHGSIDGFIQALNSNGSFLWAKQIVGHGPGPDLCQSLIPLVISIRRVIFMLPPISIPARAHVSTDPVGQCDIFLSENEHLEFYVGETIGRPRDVGHDLAR